MTQRVRAERLQRLYDELAAQHGLGPAEVWYRRSRPTGGTILYGYRDAAGVWRIPHRVDVSPHMDEAEQDVTLRHEAAHAWAFAQGDRKGHNATWKRGAALMGLSGAKAEARSAPSTEASRKRTRAAFRAWETRRLRAQGLRGRYDYDPTLLPGLRRMAG
jgi:SprT-like family protein